MQIEVVGFELDLGDGRLDDHSLDALYAKSQAQLVKDPLLLSYVGALDHPSLALGGQVVAVIQPLLGGTQGQSGPLRTVLELVDFGSLGLRPGRYLGEPCHLAGQRLALGLIVGQDLLARSLSTN
jgi:hypothetical protein